MQHKHNKNESQNHNSQETPVEQQHQLGHLYRLKLQSLRSNTNNRNNKLKKINKRQNRTPTPNLNEKLAVARRPQQTPQERESENNNNNNPNLKHRNDFTNPEHRQHSSRSVNATVFLLKKTALALTEFHNRLLIIAFPNRVINTRKRKLYKSSSLTKAR